MTHGQAELIPARQKPLGGHPPLPRGQVDGGCQGGLLGDPREGQRNAAPGLLADALDSTKATCVYEEAQWLVVSTRSCAGGGCPQPPRRGPFCRELTERACGPGRWGPSLHTGHPWVRDWRAAGAQQGTAKAPTPRTAAWHLPDSMDGGGPRALSLGLGTWRLCWELEGRSGAAQACLLSYPRGHPLRRCTASLAGAQEALLAGQTCCRACWLGAPRGEPLSRGLL